MKVIYTLSEIIDKGKWMEFCQLKGWNEWCVNEGRADSKEEVTLTEEEAEQLGLLPQSPRD